MLLQTKNNVWYVQVFINVLKISTRHYLHIFHLFSFGKEMIALYRIIMKKNMISTHRSSTNQLPFSELFTNYQSRERIIEELRKGTLFKVISKKETETKSHTNDRGAEQPRTWIYDIKLGLENPSQLQSTREKNLDVKKLSKLPNISKCQSLHKEIHQEKRCDRITCLTKKLAKIAAWNVDNSKNIHKNIEKLEKSLHLDSSTLTQNDFWRVGGMNYPQEKSLESSLIELDKSSILENSSGFNPFSKFPVFSETVGNWGPKKLEKKERRSRRNIQDQEQNSCIPPFLMSSIMFNSSKSNLIK